MFRYYKHKNIDYQKWDKCIEKAEQATLYAFSWYLDACCMQTWDALIEEKDGEYVAVIPLPLRTRWSLKLISQPFFAQQLGIYGKPSSTFQIIDFEKIITRKCFIKITYCFNELNEFQNYSEYRITYQLSLASSSEELFNNFSSQRKRDIKKGLKANLTVKSISSTQFWGFYEEYLPGRLSTEKFYFEEGKQVSKVLNERGLCSYLGVFKEDILVSVYWFSVSKKYITYLGGISNEIGYKHGASSLGFYYIIKQYDNSERILDFEGGNNPKIGDFFKGFGATETQFPTFQRNNVPDILKLFKR